MAVGGVAPTYVRARQIAWRWARMAASERWRLNSTGWLLRWPRMRAMVASRVARSLSKPPWVLALAPLGEPGGWPPAGDCTQRSEEHTSELQSLMRISYAV